MCKKLQILVFTFLLISCNIETSTNKFKNINCQPETMPKFDYRATITKGQLMTPEIDSMLRIEKRRNVFKPCRELTYLAVFRNQKNEIVIESQIRLTPTGKRWKYQPEKQDEVIIQYEYNKSDIISNSKIQLNKTLNTGLVEWTSLSIVGIIENVEKIWMHPFRRNQYNFTEVAPFPQVEFPLKIGKKWSDNSIRPGKSYGDWSNKQISSTFEVKAKENIVTKFGKINDCWRIFAESEFDFGKSTLEYWFNEELGFVKFNYTNYGNQTLEIELIKVENHSM